MLKQHPHLALALVVLGSIAPGIAVAESIKKADKQDIVMRLKAASRENSAYAASLIGESDGRVFIEYVTGIHAGSFLSKGQKRVVYWSPRSEITDEQLAQFSAYRDKFRLLDALKPGMTQAEAPAMLKPPDFERGAAANRAAAGGSGEDQTSGDIPAR